MNEWKPCSDHPNDRRRVLVWHRYRKCCRFFVPVVGFWNGSEWRNEDSHWENRLIYQPKLWKEIDYPPET